MFLPPFCHLLAPQRLFCCWFWSSRACSDGLKTCVRVVLCGDSRSPGSTVSQAAPRQALRGWTTKFASSDTVGAKATISWQGSGPAPGVLGLETGSVSSKAIQNYFPSTKNGSIEFVFDPKTNTFAVGKPTNNLGGSPHQQLAETIKSPISRE